MLYMARDCLTFFLCTCLSHPQLNHDHIFSLLLSKDRYFNSGLLLFISSNLKSCELKRDSGCPGPNSETDGVPAHLQPDSDLFYLQAEPKQNIDFGAVAHDLHLCNKIVSATNIQFFFCLMEIGFFMWE